MIRKFLDPHQKQGGFTPEEQAELKTAYAEIEKNLGTKVADQVKSAVDSAISPIQKQNSELAQWKLDKEKADAENQKAIDTLVKERDEFKKKAEQRKGQTASEAMREGLEKHQDALKNYTKNRTAVQLDLKVVGDIGSGNFTVSGTPAFIPGAGLWEPGRKPYEMRHVRDFMRVVAAPAGMDTYVIRDMGGEGGPTSVAPGTLKPQSDRDWVKTIVPYTKIAHYYKIPEEYLQDIPWLQDEITGVGVEELLALEDTKVLTNNAGGEFLGLNQTFNSTAFNAPASLDDFFAAAVGANNYDALVAAWTQLRVLKSLPTGVLVNPIDYAQMILTKASDGQYVFGAPNQSIPNLFGAPIVPHTAVASDKFFVGDFSKVKIAVKNGLSVRFYDQNEDDAIHNVVTVVIEERISMAADRADRIIYGDFSDAKAEMTASS